MASTSTRSALRRQWKNAFLKSQQHQLNVLGRAAGATATASSSSSLSSSSNQQRHRQWTASSSVAAVLAACCSATVAATAVADKTALVSDERRENDYCAEVSSPRRAAAAEDVVRCEEATFLPYRRRSQRGSSNNKNFVVASSDAADDGNSTSSCGGSGGVGGSGSSVLLGPWQSVTSAASRRSLLHRGTKSKRGNATGDGRLDMHEKYDVDFNTVLGEGAYGRVHPARLVKTGEEVALKKISKQYTNSASFSSEIDALRRIYENGGHPNITGLRDMYEDYSHYYLFLDLARGGEMFDQLVRNGQYSEFDASRLVTEILSALAFLHNIGVIHADLKPENVLLCSKKKGAETVKIIDFGCASVDERGSNSGELQQQKQSSSGIFSGKQKTQSLLPSSSSIGTKAYWSPERFQMGAAPPTEPADLWALGVIVFIMLVGVHPFDVKGIASDEEIEDEIQKRASPPMSLASHLSPSARDFIKSLMEPDPDKRLTAITALRHPWIRGVTPTSNIIEGSDTKLSMYQDLREKLASGIFAALVDGENLRGNDNGSSNTRETQSLTHLLKRAFEVFDKEGKGYINEDDLGRVMTKVTGSAVSPSDSKDMMMAAKKGSGQPSIGLSLSDFMQLFSRLSHQHYKRGDYIYHPGDKGDAMYFINSGKVEVLTKKGHLVSILRHGDFFGEGSLLEDRNHRITAARCSTPVDVIAVSKDDFIRYLASSSTKRSIKLKHKARTLAQAKQLIRLQTNLTTRQLSEGDVVYHEGDIGKSMFLVDEGTLTVKHGEKTLHELTSGDSFGESSLLFRRLRSSTVVCASAVCVLHELKRDEFFALLESDPPSARAFNDMCRTRMFGKAAKSYLLSTQNSSELGLGKYNIDELMAKVFHDADKDKSGTLSLSEVRDLMLHMGKNSAIPEKDVKELLESLDVDEDGQVTLKDILEISKAFK